MDSEHIEAIEASMQVLKSAESADSRMHDLLHAFSEWFGKYGMAQDAARFPAEVNEMLTRMAEEIAKVRAEAAKAYELPRLPLEHVLNGLPLTRAEYHLLSAEGFFEEGTSKALGLSPYDDFEAFSMLC